MILATTIAICVLSAVATFIMLLLAFGTDNPQGVLFFSCWNVSVYVAIAGAAMAIRPTPVAAMTMLFAAMCIGGLSTFVLYGSLSPFFFQQANNGPGVMNCGGPFIELGLPILQWPVAFACTIVARCSGRSRKQTPHD